MYTASAIFGVLALFGFILLFFVEVRQFNATGANRYSFVRNLPFELNCFRRHSKGSYVYAISLAVLGFVYIFPFLGFAIITSNSANHQFRAIFTAYTLFVLSVISIASFIALSFIKLSNFKLHITCSSIFIVSVFVSVILIGLTFSNYYFVYFQIQNVVRYIILIICLLLFGFILFLMFNPSRKDRAKLVKIDGENYQRPKYSYLCMLEWGGFLSLLLIYVPLYLGMFF